MRYQKAVRDLSSDSGNGLRTLKGKEGCGCSGRGGCGCSGKNGGCGCSGGSGGGGYSKGGTGISGCHGSTAIDEYLGQSNGQGCPGSPNPKIGSCRAFGAFELETLATTKQGPNGRSTQDRTEKEVLDSIQIRETVSISRDSDFSRLLRTATVNGKEPPTAPLATGRQFPSDEARFQVGLQRTSKDSPLVPSLPRNRTSASLGLRYGSNKLQQGSSVAPGSEAFVDGVSMDVLGIDNLETEPSFLEKGVPRSFPNIQNIDTLLKLFTKTVGRLDSAAYLEREFDPSKASIGAETQQLVRRNSRSVVELPVANTSTGFAVRIDKTGTVLPSQTQFFAVPSLKDLNSTKADTKTCKCSNTDMPVAPQKDVTVCNTVRPYYPGCEFHCKNKTIKWNLPEACGPAGTHACIRTPTGGWKANPKANAWGHVEGYKCPGMSKMKKCPCYAKKTPCPIKIDPSNKKCCLYKCGSLFGSYYTTTYCDKQNRCRQTSQKIPEWTTDPSACVPLFAPGTYSSMHNVAEYTCKANEEDPWQSKGIKCECALTEAELLAKNNWKYCTCVTPTWQGQQCRCLESSKFHCCQGGSYPPWVVNEKDASACYATGGKLVGNVPWRDFTMGLKSPCSSTSALKTIMRDKKIYSSTTIALPLAAGGALLGGKNPGIASILVILALTSAAKDLLDHCRKLYELCTDNPWKPKKRGKKWEMIPCGDCMHKCITQGGWDYFLCKINPKK